MAAFTEPTRLPPAVRARRPQILPAVGLFVGQTWAILDNAIDYGGRTAIDVTISLDAPAGDLAVTIADHGPGVPAGDRDRLFRRFERGAQRPSGEGSGLGLYVSRELCRAMSGDLVLEPDEPGRGGGGGHGGGRGAAFTLHLPAEAPEET